MAKRSINDFSDIVRGMLNDVQQIKSAQSLGSDSLIGYLTHSDNINDLSTHLNGFETKKFRLTFLNDTATNGAIEKLSFFWSVNQPDVMNFYTPAWLATPTVSAQIQKEPPQGDRSTWIFILRNNDGAATPCDAYVKVFFNGTDSGSFNFVQI